MGNPDYDAVMPDVTQAPFTITPKNPPGDYKYKDYVPKDSSSVVVRRDEKEQRKKFQRRPNARYTADYISPEDSKVRRKNDKASIRALAKEIYFDGSKHRKLYKEAQELVESATVADTKSPSKELHRAMKILSRNKPITKEDALEKATEQFYGLKVQ